MAELWYGKTEQEIETYADKLDISIGEARDMIKDDYLIEHGEDLFPLTPEQEKASKEARKLGFRKSSSTKKTRTRKEDVQKREIIEYLQQALLDGGYVAHDGEEVLLDVTNPERQIDFTCGDRKLRIVLSAPRK